MMPRTTKSRPGTTNYGGLGVARTPMRPHTRVPKHRAPQSDSHRDPVEVFCRVKPADGDEESCINIVDDTTIQLSPPESSRAFFTGKETQHSFKGVFDQDCRQADVFQRVGLPLVEDLLGGKNGLLFTYGVTGSGKTYTMQGSLEDGGIMTKCIDVIFNTVGNLQTKKFRLKPDRLNGFEIVTEGEAALARQEEMFQNIRTTKARRQNSSDPDLSGRVMETMRVTADEDCQYAVFISYVEVYNNYIYDLLEKASTDIVTGKPKLMSKMLREDSFRNMYVHGVTEVEIKSSEDALEAFFRGQRQRKVAQTLLNLNSSRSHSVFNIRVAAIPYDPVGEDIMNDSAIMTVSQLALVDLAGSERTARTGNTGERLQEASKINQSLMTLRSCIETLRENQQTGTTKMVPYRDSRVTHLFRNYFEGEGKVKMIVCVNPRASDFDENVNVMKFAELTQEVQIDRPQAVKFDLGLTPGRRRGNQIYKEALRRLETKGVKPKDLPDDAALIYNLGPAWPSLYVKECDDEEAISKLVNYLERRIATRTTLLSDHSTKIEEFRNLLRKLDEEVVLLRNENVQLKAQVEGERKKQHQLETKLANAESANRSLSEKVNAYADMKIILENELDVKELKLNAEQRERIRTKQKYIKKINNEKEKVNKISNELDRKLHQQRLKMSEKITGKLSELNQILNDDDDTEVDENVENGAVRRMSNVDHSAFTRKGRNSMKGSSSDAKLSTSESPTKLSSIAVVNNRHRRSHSADPSYWIDHRPNDGTVPLNTVLQPVLKRKKSVTKLEEKDVVNRRSSRYLLTTQTQDEEGEMETRLYKGDILPTVGGGRQVVFNDIEVLKQESPTGLTKVSPRKRSYEECQGIREKIKDIEGRCAFGIEGRASVTPIAARTRKRSRL